MSKTLLAALAVSGLLSFAAHAQTIPANTTPSSNHTAGTTTSPVDPTSKAGQTMSGTTGRSASGKTMPDRSASTGNHTAGTTANPVDPTSEMAGTTRPNTRGTRKTHKTKMRVSN